MGQISKFYTTNHFIQRVKERGLSVAIAKDVINYHDKKHQQYRGPHNGFVYRFEKAIEGKTVTVAAEIKKTECWLVTIFEAEDENDNS